MPAGTFKVWLKADRVGVEGTQHVQRPKGQKELGALEDRVASIWLEGSYGCESPRFS